MSQTEEMDLDMSLKSEMMEILVAVMDAALVDKLNLNSSELEAQRLYLILVKSARLTMLQTKAKLNVYF